MKKASIIVGLGFGDEGKGLVSDYLCSNGDKAIVVRFNGGQQAGHTVISTDGNAHTFSCFGSGTLRGIPTFWSKYCTFSPEDFLLEYKTFKTRVKFFLDNKSPVTTHYDVLFNRAIEATKGRKKIGSTGSGFPCTVERHNEKGLCLYAIDLLNQNTVKEKLSDIRVYYKNKIDRETKYHFEQFDHNSEDKKFLEYLTQLRSLAQRNILVFVNEHQIVNDKSEWQHYIFEGAQGILLDMHHGTKPHITKSNTTSKNAIDILERNFKIGNLSREIFYVTRAYHTRHGSGPFKTYKPKLQLQNNHSETNQYNKFQGRFRVNYLNVDLLNYSLCCDELYSKGVQKHLVITCLDQIKTPKIEVYKNDCRLNVSPDELPRLLNINFINIYLSYSKYSSKLLMLVNNKSLKPCI